MREVALRGLTWDHPRGFGPLQALSRVSIRDTAFAVTWERRSLRDFGDVPIASMAAAHDLLIVDHPHIGAAAHDGSVLRLDAWLDEPGLGTLAQQSAGPSHRSYHYEGHQWAFAIDAAMMSSAYRPDLLEDALPTSWDEVLVLADHLRVRGAWLGVPLNTPTITMCAFLTLCANLGSPPGENGAFVASDVGLEALSLLKRLAELALPECAGLSTTQFLDRMSTHDDLAYSPLVFAYSNYARDDTLGSKLRFAPIPGSRGALLGGAGIAVSARCAHPEEAVRYAAWLCSADVQRTAYVRYGGQPGNIVAWEDDEVNALTNGFFRSNLRAVQEAYLRPRHPGFASFQVGGGEVLKAFLAGAVDGPGCVLELSERYDSSLAER